MKEKVNSVLDKLFEKPLIAVPVSIFAYYIVWKLIGELGSTTVSSYAIRLVFGAVVAVFVFWLRKDHMYSCGIKKRGIKAFTVIIPVAVICVAAVINTTLKNPDMPKIVYLYAALFAMEAGVCEEMMVRGIPLGNTLWKNNNIKDIFKLCVYTSVIFGLLHLGNFFRTGDIFITGTQACVDIFAGLFFAAVYIRTGSIIPGMVGHALWDYFLMCSPDNLVDGDFSPIHQMGDVVGKIGQNLELNAETILAVRIMSFLITVLAVGAFWMILTRILVRKSKRDEIVDNFTKED